MLQLKVFNVCLGFFSLATAAVSLEHTEKKTEPDWYPYNPNAWGGDVAHHRKICAEGHMQSPVELPPCHEGAAQRAALGISWGNQKFELMNNGRTVQLTVKSDTAGEMQVNREKYRLIQCHFHWGSEHTIGGQQQTMVAHCVHVKLAKGRKLRFGVVGIFYELGTTDDPFLKQIEDHLPDPPSHKDHVHGDPRVASFVGPVNFDLLYGSIALTKYWTYPGSLTTPPCTEAVDWFLLMERKVMTPLQYAKFKAAIGWNAEGGNYRPPQLLYGRQVVGCLWGPPVNGSVVARTDWYPYDVRRWAAAERANQICKAGHMQSPVELPICRTGMSDRPKIDHTWGEHHVELMNNGHTVQLTIDSQANKSGGGIMIVDGHAYKLIQCHFHWGSEHTIGGVQEPMVAHCVHLKIAKGREMRFGVLGIFYDIGEDEDPFLKTFEDYLPAAPDSDNKSVNGKARLSTFVGPVNFDLATRGIALNHYWTYPGSLTTPPCTEAVDWFLLMGKRVISKAQYNKFRAAIGWNTEGGNFRPPQLLYGRQVIGCDQNVTAVEHEVISVVQDETHTMIATVLGLALLVLVCIICGVHQHNLRSNSMQPDLPYDVPLIIKKSDECGRVLEWERQRSQEEDCCYVLKKKKTSFGLAQKPTWELSPKDGELCERLDSKATTASRGSRIGYHFSTVLKEVNFKVFSSGDSQKCDTKGDTESPHPEAHTVGNGGVELENVHVVPFENYCTDA